jgi:hypothetical protein
MPATRIELLQGMPIFGAIREDVLQYLLEQANVVAVPLAATSFAKAMTRRACSCSRPGARRC